MEPLASQRAPLSVMKQKSDLRLRRENVGTGGVSVKRGSNEEAGRGGERDSEGERIGGCRGIRGTLLICLHVSGDKFLTN